MYRRISLIVQKDFTDCIHAMDKGPARELGEYPLKDIYEKYAHLIVSWRVFREKVTVSITQTCLHKDYTITHAW